MIAQRIAKGGVTQFFVKWAGYEPKHNTWEPLEHLAGCEDMIADFKEREQQRVAELDVAAIAKLSLFIGRNAEPWVSDCPVMSGHVR